MISLIVGMLMTASSVGGYTPLSASDPVGRIYEYVRSNRDGSLPESIVVYRKSVTEIEVYKSVERCESAAYVTATLDPQTMEARSLIAGKLARDGSQSVIGQMNLAPDSREITAHIDLPEIKMSDTITAPDLPWQLYDYDLASLTVITPHLKDKHKDFSFGLALVLVTENPDDFFSYLGKAAARYIGEDIHNGHKALRYQVGGPAFGDKGGPLWLDAEDGHVIAAEFGLPNHLEYDNFKLELQQLSDGGESEWRQRLMAHYANCLG